jgi:transcription-repair coupling factor (superfamily II helicase)
MNYFEQRLAEILQKSNITMESVGGCSPELLLFLVGQSKLSKDKNFIWFSSLSTRQNLSRFQNESVLIWDRDFLDPTDQILNHEAMLNLLCKFYHFVLFETGKHCFIPWELAFFKAPAIKFFAQNALTINSEDILSQATLKDKLLLIGYQDGQIGSLGLGEFCFRGDMCDIRTSSDQLYRLIYFDELIEHIYEVDPKTNRALKSSPLLKINIIASWRIFLLPQNLNILRENIPQPTPKFKDRFHQRKEFFNSLTQPNASFSFYYLPFFSVEKNEALIYQLENYPCHKIFIQLNQQLPILESQLNLWSEKVTQAISDEFSPILLPNFDRIFEFNFSKSLNKGLNLEYNYSSKPIGQWDELNSILKPLINEATKRLSKVELFIKWFKTIELSIQNVFLCYSTEEEKEHLLAIVNNRWSFLKKSDSFQLHWVKTNFLISAYEELTQLLIISAKDYVYTGANKNKKTTRHVDLFAEHLSTLKEGDFVVHQGFGIGKFVEMQNMTVSNQNSDFIVLKFLDDDKVYVPIYKMNLLEKFADNDANVKLSDLKTKKFEQEKTNARASAKKLAFDLLRLEAERKAHKGFAFSAPDEFFEEFESSFAFEETPDQAQAISDVIDDMCKPIPMDRLICGDVGFGKTEVAMRAAFKAILDKKQVVVLVPTTILCLQHYNNFKKRFSSFGVNIAQLSRLVTPKEAQTTIEKLKNGQCDLVVSTHKILSKEIGFF